MTRFTLLLPLALVACSGPAQTDTTPANKVAEIDALARNLSAQADAWRDETDNREAAAAAEAGAAAADNLAGVAAPATATGNRP